MESVFRQAKPAVPGYRSAALVSQNAKAGQGLLGNWDNMRQSEPVECIECVQGLNY